MDKFSKGFTRVPNKISNILPLIDLSARGWRVFWLVLRLTHGCQCRWAKLKKSDLKTIGILPSSAKKVLDTLLTKGYIIQNGKTKEYRLNEEYLSSEVTKKVGFELEKLRSLIAVQLKERSSQFRNKIITEPVINDLLDEEYSGYQSSNNEGLLDKEGSNSNESDSIPPKDRLNKELNKPIDRNSSKEVAQYRGKVNPYNFPIMNYGQEQILKAWEMLEPDKPDSFDFYHSALKKGVPGDKLMEFANDLVDSRVKNKGAVFVKKVEEYLKRRN